MGLTINLTQWKRKKRNDGTIPIYIRLTENRKSRYLSTGVSILPKYWNSTKQKVRGTHPRSNVLNYRLRELRYNAEDKRNELQRKGKLDINTLKAEIKENDYNSLIKVARRYHDSLEGTERHHEWKKVGVLINNLEAFLGDTRMDVNQVDAAFIEDFQQYLLEEVGNNPNTTRRKLTSFKGLFNHLLKAGTINHDPFLQVEKVERNEVEKTRLSIKQIKAIKDVDLEPGSNQWHTRNYFLFSFYNAGIRFGDLCCLQWKNLKDGRLKYKMMKTGGLKNIKQQEPMLEILEYYRRDDATDKDLIFPILDKLYADPAELRRKIGSKNVLVNKWLGKIRKKAEIETKISFHVSRHSFAHHALTKGMSLYSISKALGHKDLETTQEYLETFDEDKLDSDMSTLF
ncbi:Site-specific recombinase XerD [Fodinibius roseus]|uniref:Site-specific recombinase XerD n=1 Tax=Fodinibius roseus TaxID=1194090 RepID=A0A1M4UPR4_9BACT|nr:site-specific integrase [Fodinibius roseus]SHE58590.1 Site-specific recombinase XerD [Fodinibius roseus]